MFDVGFWELLVLFGIALMVLGPERLPQVAKRAGTWVGQARALARSLRTQLESEVELDSLRRQAPSGPPPAPPKPNPASVAGRAAEAGASEEPQHDDADRAGGT